MGNEYFFIFTRRNGSLLTRITQNYMYLQFKILRIEDKKPKLKNEKLNT